MGRVAPVDEIESLREQLDWESVAFVDRRIRPKPAGHSVSLAPALSANRTPLCVESARAELAEHLQHYKQVAHEAHAEQVQFISAPVLSTDRHARRYAVVTGAMRCRDRSGCGLKRRSRSTG